MERETLTEVSVSAVAVAVFVAVFVAVGIVYSTADGSSLDGAGGLALVGSITFFVVLMAVAGYWLAE